MSTTTNIQYRTRMFARVLGPYLLIAAASLVGRPAYVRTLLQAFDTNSAWLWVTGAFILPMGLVVVALHPYWRGPAAAIVSTLGWMTVLKGVGLMTFPETYLTMGRDAAAATPWWLVSVVIMVLAGLYLTFVGWVPSRQQTESMAPAA